MLPHRYIDAQTLVKPIKSDLGKKLKIDEESNNEMMKWINEQRDETASWLKPNRPTDFAAWPPSEDNIAGLDLKQAMGAFFYGDGGVVGDMEQVWSLTQFYSVDFSQSMIGEQKCVFNKRTIKVCISCF